MNNTRPETHVSVLTIARACNDLDEILTNVRKSAESLERLKRLLGPHRGAQDLSPMINLHKSNYEKRIDQFKHGIRHLSVEDRRHTFTSATRSFRIQIGSLDFLWGAFPRFQNDLDTGSAAYPGPLDGFIVPQKAIEEARNVLTLFGKAWSEVNTGTTTHPSDYNKVTSLGKQAKIALILHIIRERERFNSFIEQEVIDDDMDNYPDHVISKLGRDNLKYFEGQYSRTRKPQWGQHDHYRFHQYEPIPLLSHGTFPDAEGAFARVDKVQDLWDPDKIYARKMISANDPSAKQHMDTEIDKLKDLSKEDHIFHFVKFVKSYQRGDQIGTLILPVANMNLHTLLNCCARMPQFRSEHRATLLRALGCLTYSLCYLHNIKRCRHRDIKPRNILYLRGSRGQPDQFLWADFGLAYAFTLKNGSRTRNVPQGTKDYEAPEVIQTLVKHGRSADVFSLGCVFLEIVSILMLTAHEAPDNVPFQCYVPYKDNIPAMKAWCQTQIDTMRRRSDQHLTKILELGRSMIQFKPEHRPKIAAVAQDLAALKKVDARNPHPFCASCAENYERDRSFRPKHPGIFKHEKGAWYTSVTQILNKLSEGSSE